ncbi:DUF3775 domain-containing protein [Rhodovarius lipocyclicus]|uniref:DUF3775 domain-containing protein n=1 Tax=Rhodovarius lipocyclicus TaxID=268410 RepID=UPI001357C9A6|nr:DUF3775 domain-containing protein [Rhodovarius lipocyclicus]
MAETDEDDTPDLGVPLEVVATIAELLSALEEDDDEELDLDDDDEDGEAEDDDDADDELTPELVEEIINELTEDEQAALVALALVGRGDHEAEEWEAAVKAAAARNRRADPAQYLLGMEGAGELLEEGLAAFGIDIADIER